MSARNLLLAVVLILAIPAAFHHQSTNRLGALPAAYPDPDGTGLRCTAPWIDSGSVGKPHVCPDAILLGRIPS